MLERWEMEFRAFEEVVRFLGTPNQRDAMNDFMSKRQLFLDQPLGASASPGMIAAALQAIFDALGLASGGFDSLKTALGTVANSIEVISNPDIFDNQQDDRAVAVTDLLTGPKLLSTDLELLDYVSYRFKMKFVSDLLDGWTDSEDEEAILTILRASKRRSPAEFMQLVVSASWEKLSFNIDGDEYEQLEGIFTF